VASFNLNLNIDPSKAKEVADQIVAAWRKHPGTRKLMEEGLKDVLGPGIEHEIPDMTDPLGQHWEQPSRAEIELRGGAAFMTRETMEKLKNYSASIPSGKYQGKMWRLCEHEASFGKIGAPDAWHIVWYGPSEKGEEYVKLNFRPIVIIQKPNTEGWLGDLASLGKTDE
jgi:hypothetical protein